MDIGWKLVSTVAGIGAGIAANQVLNKGWQVATGHNPPEEDDYSVSIVEIVVFAAVSGAVIGLARQLATRQAAKWYGGKQINPAEDLE